MEKMKTKNNPFTPILYVLLEQKNRTAPHPHPHPHGSPVSYMSLEILLPAQRQRLHFASGESWRRVM